jgi:hypothetical protein
MSAFECVFCMTCKKWTYNGDDVSARPTACFISGTDEWISIKFGFGTQKVVGHI